MKCTCCGVVIPPARLKAVPGTTTCVDCSTVERKAAVDVCYHKTGNTIELVDQATSANMAALSKRAGYGIMRGLRGSGPQDTRVKLGNRSCAPGVQYDAAFYQRCVAKVMDFMEAGQDMLALEAIDDWYQARQIKPKECRWLREMVNGPRKAWSPPNRDEAGAETNWVFKNWRNQKNLKI